MATSGNRGGGRRSKGERRFVGSRVPVNQADNLAIVAKHEGLTVSDMIAVAIDEKLGHYDIDRLTEDEEQESLPMRQLAS
jgi:hypothetical protein